jgi:hypothetical protein
MIDEAGEAHIAGSGLCGLETICGNVWTEQKYEYDVGTPTCSGCIDAAKDLLKQCTPKEIKSW